MKKIVITQYRKEPSGSTFMAYTYNYGIDFRGGTYYSYSVTTTQEGIGEIARVFKEAGYEIEWKEPK